MTARVNAFDTETGLIRPACLAPPLVCVTWQQPGAPAEIEHHSTVRERLRDWLLSELVLVGHNVAYDLAVIAQRFPELIELIFEAYENDRITDTMIRQQLLDIAGGAYRRSVGAKGKRIAKKYDLATTAKRCANMILEKDGWRLTYSEFLHIPLEHWIEKAKEIQAAALIKLANNPPEHEVENLQSIVNSRPEQCREYPLDDARATLASHQAQEKHVAFLADQFRQSRAAWWLYLSSAHGMKTDERGVEILRREITAQLAEVELELQQAGLVRADGSRDTAVAKLRMIDVCKREGLDIPRTDAHCTDEAKCSRAMTLTELEAAKAAKSKAKKITLEAGADECTEHVCLDNDACTETEDPILMMYAELSTLKKVLTNDVEALAKGVFWPVHTRYGLAETGRTTSSKPNIQNVRRRPGIREAFIPRPGKVFMQADFPQLELYTLAQCCISWFGKSKLADALNAGMDPHLWVAAIMLKITYEAAEAAHKDKKHPQHKAVKDARQLAKPANFGFPGGLGAETFIAFARTSLRDPDPKAKDPNKFFRELDLTTERVKELKAQWLSAWPEMAQYFARVNTLCANPSNRATVETLFTKRTRGQASFCAACNNGFQALGADCAKEAGWRITKEMYVAKHNSPLFNARIVAFVHDEFIAEVDDAPIAHDAAYRMAQLMTEGANMHLPDVPVPLAKVVPSLMRRWSKNAETLFDEKGRLVAWEQAA